MAENHTHLSTVEGHHQAQSASSSRTPWRGFRNGFDAVNPYREIGERAHASTDLGRASLLHVEPDFLSDMAVVNVRAAANHILLMSEVEPLPGTAEHLKIAYFFRRSAGGERRAKRALAAEGNAGDANALAQRPQHVSLELSSMPGSLI